MFLVKKRAEKPIQKSDDGALPVNQWEPTEHKSGDLWRGLGHTGYQVFLRDGVIRTSQKGQDGFKTGGATYFASDPFQALEYAKHPTEAGREAQADRPRYLLHVRPTSFLPVRGYPNGEKATHAPVPASMVHAVYEIAPGDDPAAGLVIRRIPHPFKGQPEDDGPVVYKSADDERPAGWPAEAPLLRDREGKLLTPHAETGRVEYLGRKRDAPYGWSHHFYVHPPHDPRHDAEGWHDVGDWEADGHQKGDLWRGTGSGGYQALLRDKKVATNGKGEDYFKTGGATYYAPDPHFALFFAQHPVGKYEGHRDDDFDGSRYLLHVRPHPKHPFTVHTNEVDDSQEYATHKPVPASMIHAVHELRWHPSEHGEFEVSETNDGFGYLRRHPEYDLTHKRLMIRQIPHPFKSEGQPMTKSVPVAKSDDDRLASLFAPLQRPWQSAARQPHTDQHELYRAAPHAHREFAALLDHGQGLDRHLGAAVFHPGERPQPEHYAGPGSFIRIGNLKGLSRATQKVHADYGGRWDHLRDIVRGSVALDNLDDVRRVTDYLHNSSAKVETVNNRFARPTPAGYRDGLLHVRLPESGLLAEMQVHLKPILEAKERGHAAYETMRDIEAKYAGRQDEHLDPADYRAYHQALKESRAIYGAAWKRAGGGDTQRLPEDYMLHYPGGRRGSNDRFEEAPPLDYDDYAMAAKSEGWDGDRGDGVRFYHLDHHVILRERPGVGPERETAAGWVPYHQLVRFAHEATPISAAEAGHIRGGWVRRRRPRDDEE